MNLIRTNSRSLLAKKKEEGLGNNLRRPSAHKEKDRPV